MIGAYGLRSWTAELMMHCLVGYASKSFKADSQVNRPSLGLNQSAQGLTLDFRALFAPIRLRKIRPSFKTQRFQLNVFE